MIEVMAKLLTRCDGVEFIVVGGGEVILEDVTIALGKLVAWNNITPSDKAIVDLLVPSSRVALRPSTADFSSPQFPFDRTLAEAGESAGARRLVGGRRGDGQPAPCSLTGGRPPMWKTVAVARRR